MVEAFCVVRGAEGQVTKLAPELSRKLGVQVDLVVREVVQEVGHLLSDVLLSRDILNDLGVDICDQVNKQKRQRHHHPDRFSKVRIVHVEFLETVVHQVAADALVEVK